MPSDENDNSLKIPGWFVRLNLIMVPTLFAPLIGWLIWKALDNSERLRVIESRQQATDADIDLIRDDVRIIQRKP